MSSIPPASMPPLIFPETADFIRKTRTNKKISFTYLLAVVYIYGGVSAFLWIVSKTILNPLFLQLTYDRRVYYNKAIELLGDLNVKLSSLVSFIPPIRESLAGEKYADAQTQTDMDPSSTGPSSYYSTSVTATVSTTSEKSVSFESSSHLTPAEAANARTTRLCEKLNLLSSNLESLYEDSACKNSGPLRYSLLQLKSSTDTLSSGLDLDRIPGTKTRTEKVQDVKKEIRSFKGSFLSARSFPGINR